MIPVAMKTTPTSSSGHRMPAAAISCQTHTKPSTAEVRQPIMRKNWVKVSSQPPTYYPKGVPANIDTDHWIGDWVYADDETGSRYFIPLHGMGTRRESLVHDALSARSERKLAVIEAEDGEILARNIRNQILFGPPAYAGLLLAAHAGATSFEIDAERLQREWATSKQPH
jgi:hypothetical protein